jgi:hypothetical protein
LKILKYPTVAVINSTTNIIENHIVATVEDPAPEGYIFVSVEPGAGVNLNTVWDGLPFINKTVKEENK